VNKTRANVEFFVQACPTAEDYLLPLKNQGIDTLILGCTHYPLLSGVIQYVMGDQVVLVSSAEPTANEVYARLLDGDMLNRSDEQGQLRFLLSGPPDPELGRRFLGPEFSNVESHAWGKP
jgi:glutamate racemase